MQRQPSGKLLGKLCAFESNTDGGPTCQGERRGVLEEGCFSRFPCTGANFTYGNGTRI